MEKSHSLILSREGRVLNWKKQFLGRLDNNHGQSLVTWLLVLLMILFLTLSAGAAMSLVQDRMHLVNLCRIETLKTQSSVEPILKRLLSLNTQARLLRLLKLAAKARLAAAVAHYNIPMAVRARYEISQIRNQQQLLDQLQKSLVKSANVILYTRTFATYAKLQKAFAEVKFKNRGFADLHFVLQNPKIPKLAVKPEDYNLAPPYLVRDNFEKIQSISLFWSQDYKIKGLLKAHHQSMSQCHATLEENTWVPKIRKDRLYSKWL